MAPARKAAAGGQPKSEDATGVDGLRRRLKSTKVLEPRLRRHWLEVLPHLKPEDRRRLDQILREAEQALTNQADS